MLISKLVMPIKRKQNEATHLIIIGEEEFLNYQIWQYIMKRSEKVVRHLKIINVLHFSNRIDEGKNGIISTDTNRKSI